MRKSDGRILIVDDNEELLVALQLYLSPHFREIETIKSPNLIPEYMGLKEFDLILLDMNFTAGITTGNEGIYWMRRVLEIDPAASVVLITAFGEIGLAVKAMKEGATDFIEKSWDEQKILSTILSAFKIQQSRREIQKLKNRQKHLSDQINEEYKICHGESDSMKRVFETIEKIAATDVNVLILGENGTGKDLIAREIHRKSLRRDEIFVSVDLGSLNENLFESELFGYEKGAFTDAKNSKSGRFEIASGGTLYLDEIGNLQGTLQSKLLSAIETRKVTRLGSVKEVPVDIRLISATNKPLYDMAENGGFREDLLYRINTIQIDLPALRDRADDIPSLAFNFLSVYAGKYNKNISGISKAGMEKLIKHSWYGNIRELEHSIEKAVILSEKRVLDTGDFQFYSRSGKADHVDNYNLAVHEKRLIDQALQKFKGNISLTARELGINRTTLYDKIRKYGL